MRSRGQHRRSIRAGSRWAATATDDVTDKTPLLIPGFVIEERIAEGGFGVVWRALHRETQETVAIKVLHAELVSSHDIILRFKREAEAIAQLHHPNVVELFHYGRLIDGRPYLVMEYLDGDNVAVHLERHGPIPPEKTLEVMEPLCDALGKAHDLGIVHRDLKASNVILCQEPAGMRAVLLDFGIAKLIEQTGDPITAVRQAVGSPVCISPEQIRGDYVDARTDVYGLGSLAFHILTGSPPFEGSWLTVMDKHLFGERPLPSARIDITPAFDHVVVKAMSLEPLDRYPGPREFLADWRRAVHESQGIVQAPEVTPAGSDVDQPVIGCYIDVRAEEALLDEPPEALLDDMASILPTAEAFLVGHGFLLAYESGDSALYVLPYDDKVAAAAASAHAGVIDLAAMLLPTLRVRPGAHDGVHINLFLHVGDAYLMDGEVAGGSILDSTDWVLTQETSRYGLYASNTFCRDVQLDRSLTPVSEHVQRLGIR